MKTTPLDLKPCGPAAAGRNRAKLSLTTALTVAALIIATLPAHAHDSPAGAPADSAITPAPSSGLISRGQKLSQQETVVYAQLERESSGRVSAEAGGASRAATVLTVIGLTVAVAGVVAIGYYASPKNRKRDECYPYYYY